MYIRSAVSLRAHLVLGVVTCLAGIAEPAHAQTNASSEGTLTIQVKDIEDRSGTLNVALFASEDGFPGEAKQALRRYSVNLTDQGEETPVEVVFAGLPFGTYAVAIYHDENENEELDTNFMGAPREGIGFSNDASARFSAPDFSEASFPVQAERERLSIRMRY